MTINHSIARKRFATPLLALAALLIVSFPAQAQKTFAVRTYDTLGVPMSGVIIRIVGIKGQSVTDDSGWAMLLTEFEGQHTIRVTKPNYQTTQLYYYGTPSDTSFYDVAMIPGDPAVVSWAYESRTRGRLVEKAGVALGTHMSQSTIQSIPGRQRIDGAISRLALSEVTVTTAGASADKGVYTGGVNAGFSVHGSRGTANSIQINGVDISANSITATPGVVAAQPSGGSALRTRTGEGHASVANASSYSQIHENEYRKSFSDPISTFSIDVDAASYTNVRRFIMEGTLPPADAVRVEELTNYFTYSYPEPTGKVPFTIMSEMASCPWNPKHQVVEVAVHGRTIEKSKLPPSNLVFLIDVSGSMMSSDKLDLIKQGLTLLVNELRAEDRVAIVTYAGAAGLVLPSTSGANKAAINQAIDRLTAGGSTAGGAGIRLAYKVAKENLLTDGNNRVILATDGDFNVGISKEEELVKLMEEKRNDGIYITLLGVGRENLKDSHMEKIADQGNGNYFYLDGIQEARKALVTQMGATLYTVAKDMKIQVEFNPDKVSEYRLIGYEDRMLRTEDFENDAKDAGELGAGHTVTALYEIVPVDTSRRDVEPTRAERERSHSIRTLYNMDEVVQVRVRYKEPKSTVSQLRTSTVFASKMAEHPTENLQFALAAAEFGMLLRKSPNVAGGSIEQVAALATAAKGADTEGYRADFLKLVRLYSLIEPEPAQP